MGIRNLISILGFKTLCFLAFESSMPWKSFLPDNYLFEKLVIQKLDIHWSIADKAKVPNFAFSWLNDNNTFQDGDTAAIKIILLGEFDSKGNASVDKTALHSQLPRAFVRVGRIFLLPQFNFPISNSNLLKFKQWIFSPLSMRHREFSRYEINDQTENSAFPIKRDQAPPIAFFVAVFVLVWVWSF